jgi:hypothetical protein
VISQELLFESFEPLLECGLVREYFRQAGPVGHADCKGEGSTGSVMARLYPQVFTVASEER